MKSLVPYFGVLILIMPISRGGYTLVFAVSLFCAGVYSLFRYQQFKKTNLFFLLFAILLWATASLSFQSPGFENIWAIREYIRVPIAFVAFLSYSNQSFFNIDKFIRFLAVCILFDYIFLFLFEEFPLSGFVMQEVAMQGMSDYLIGYWRHIGIGGNPNVSSLIYSIFLILVFHRYWKSKIIYHGFYENSFIFLTSIASFVLLLFTFSRTGILAFLLSMIVFFIRIRYIPQILFFITVLFIGLFFYSDIDLFATLARRFTSFSSLDARFEHWTNLASGYSFLDFLFGRPFESSVIDNDYLYFFYRYGFLLALFLLFVPFVPLFRIRERSNRLMYFHLIIFFYVAAIPGGALSHPKTYFWLLLFGSALVTKPNDTEKIPNTIVKPSWVLR